MYIYIYVIWHTSDYLKKVKDLEAKQEEFRLLADADKQKQTAAMGELIGR